MKKIFGLVSSDSYTIAEICASVGISERCFYKWRKGNAEFADAFTHAREVYTDKVVVEAKRSLLKLVQGYYYEETRTYFENAKSESGVSVRKFEKLVQSKRYHHPDLYAIIFTLCNCDPSNWKHTYRVQVTGKDEKELIPAKILSRNEWLKIISDLELEQRILKLDQKIKEKTPVNMN